MRGLLNRTLVCLLFAATIQTIGMTQASGACGVWRWDVKTLSDPLRTAVDFASVPKSLLRLRRLTPPASLNSTTPRLRGVERRTYDVRAQVVEAKVEDDGDIHLVIASRTYRHRTMIVEFPNPRCVASGFKRDRMRAARREVLDACGSFSTSSFTTLRGNVRIKGVGFWDEIHGQTGVAPNGIELHPVLRFRGTCSRA
ncbi:MAG: hypothetical protein M3P18_08440 [Actinomycetota bacterium]|nr:hypothetical protein [Actinomycetota bacterium]